MAGAHRLLEKFALNPLCRRAARSCADFETQSCHQRTIKDFVWICFDRKEEFLSSPMPPEIIALIDKPLLLGFVLAVGAACGMAVERISEKIGKAERRARWNGRMSAKAGSRNQPAVRNQPDVSANDNAAEQLRIVMGANFTRRPLLNKPERRLLSVLDMTLETESPGWRAHGQVSMGEILWSDKKTAFWAINAKRVDLLIVDQECQPLYAVEFQGTGHHLSEETAARDAIKKEALRRAGIGYIEVQSGDTPAEVRSLIKKLVRQNQSV